MAELTTEKQLVRLPVINFDMLVQAHKQEKRHGDLLPNTELLFAAPPTVGKPMPS